MRKIISFFLIFSLLSGFVISADAAFVNLSVNMDSSRKELIVKGQCDKERQLTLYVTDSDIAAADLTFDNIYAMEQLLTDKDGSFDTVIKFSDTFEYGDYKLIVGGLGYNVSEADRSAEFSYKSLADFSLWMEAENAVLSGNYKKISAAQSSGSARIAVDTTDTATENTAEFNFAVPADGTYDVWVLSTPGNVTYTSKYQYAFDGENGRLNKNSNLSSVYTTSDMRAVGIGWSRLSSEYLREGEHSLTFTCNSLREMNSRFIYHVLDTVVIVPEYWNWTPNKFYKPYNVYNIKMNYKSGTLNKTSLNRGDNLSVILQASLEEPINFDICLWAAIMKNGEIVSSVMKEPGTATSKWKAGSNYIISFSIPVPDFAPDSEYEVVCGTGNIMQGGFYNLNGFANAGAVTVGTQKTVVPDKVVISNASFEVSNGEISAAYILSDTNTDKSAKAYLKLWQGDTLWGVAESAEKVPLSEALTEYNATLKLPEGIPPGNYSAQLGFYGVNGTYKTDIQLSDIKGRFDYKPLSNGVYISQKTEREHFWYVNQKNALIWDGEPYIPMGGMECLNLITNYSDSATANEAYWKSDKAELDLLAEKGIKDLYINAVSGSVKAPNWVWEYVLDYMEQKGFRYSIQTNAGISNSMEVFYIRSNPSAGAVRVTGITQSGRITKTSAVGGMSDYGAVETIGGIYALVNSDGEVVDSGMCEMTEVSDGYRFSADIELPSAGTYSVSFTPFVKKSNALMCNFWDNGDKILNYASEFAKNIPMGDNVRSIIDPLGNETGYYNGTESIRPYSANYNGMFSKWLEKKYKTVSELNKAWQAGTAIDSFDTASRIIPVYTSLTNDSYDVYGLDYDSEKLYCFDGRNGVMWNDFLTFRDESTAEFYNRAANAYKEKLNIPVVIKNVWGHKEYFKNSDTVGGVDGLGTEAYGDYARIANLQTSDYGMGHQFAKTAWLIVTETSDEENIKKKYDSGKYGYESESYMHGHFDTLMEYGAKGIFDFLLSARHNEMTHTAYSYISNPNQFDWLNNYIGNMDMAAIAEYLPQKNKIYLMPHNSNFYTSPNRYTAVLYNDAYKAPVQSFVSGDTMVMMCEQPNDGEIIAANFENGPASVYQGRMFGNMLDSMSPERQAVYLGFRTDLGTVPQVDRYFTNEYSYNADGVRVQILNPPEGAEIIKTTAEGKPWAVRDGNFWIVAAEDCISDYSVKYLDDIGIFMDSDSLVQRDFRIEDANGNKADKLHSGSYKVKAQIKNNTSSPVKAALFAAAYDSSGRLTKIASSGRAVLTGLNSLEAVLDISDSEVILKGFIWNIEDSIAPISETVSVSR